MFTSKESLRSQLRNIHILASVALGVFIYSPLRNSNSFPLVMGAIVFPLLSLSGLWMWQGPRIGRWLKKKKSTT
ncbi:MAG: hypothetical protein AB8B99_13930 [Phormidesmis sp.]